MQAVADELQHLRARKAAVAQAEQGQHRAADAMRGQSRFLGQRRVEAEFRREPVDQTGVVGTERTAGDGDARFTAPEQIRDLRAHRAQLRVPRLKSHPPL
jgi:hypothetical protein